MILHIMLGTSCNWKCPYCLQLKQAGFNQKLDKYFCQRLQDFLNEKSLEIDRIEYWGGEPCLYFNQIQTIEDTIKITKRPSRFTTNGSLLTDSMIEYLNAKHMHVNLSYHEGQLSEKGWEQALKIKNLHVTSLIHAKCLSWEPYKLKWQWIQEYFGRCVNWYIYNLYNVEGTNGYCLTHSDIDQYIDYLYKIMPFAANDVFYQMAFDALFSTELSKKHNYTCACFNQDVLSIDTKGNQYLCHHACSNKFKVGNIFINGLSQININVLKPKCKTCELRDYCHGGCMREINDSSCYFLHKLNKLKEQYYAL